MQCWLMNGKSAACDALRDALNDVPNDASVDAPNVIRIVIYQTSMKFLKDGVDLEIFVI